VTIAFLFPGQGVDLAGAVGDWHASSSHVRRLLDLAARETGTSLTALVRADRDAFRSTAVYQPALSAVSVGVLLELIERDVCATTAAGHSLGEIAACVAMGALSPEDAVRVAAVRGRAMARAAALHPGGMIAICARSRAETDAALACARRGGWAQVAAHNAPDQWVLSGEWPALRAVPSRFDPRPIATDGPWHSDAMSDAIPEFRNALRALGSASGSLVCNRTGRLVAADEDLADTLAGQLVHPVEWTTTMQTLASLRVSLMITVGPAKALRMLARRNRPDVRLLDVDTPANLPHIAAQLVA
jgi:[acyl-carrier-protein] S-malonyltransferase